MCGQIKTGMRGERGPCLLISISLLALLAAVPAQAAQNPWKEGTTTLHLARSFTSLLKRNKVKLQALAPATLKGQTLTLPQSAGHVDSDSGQAALAHAGALIVKSPRGSIEIRQFTLRTTSEPLIANTNGPTMKLARGEGRSLARQGFGEAIRYRTLRLTPTFALRLDKRLKLHRLLRAGEPIGSLAAQSQPLTVAIAPRGTVSLQLDPEVLAQLEALHVSVNPIFPAEHQGFAFSFPIVLGSRLAPDASRGTLRAGGSLEFLELGEGLFGQLFVHEPWLDFEARLATAELNVLPSPPYRGRAERPSLLGISLAGASVLADPAARTIAVQGAALSFNQTLAGAFDEAFAGGKEEFGAGERFGTLGFSAVAE